MVNAWEVATQSNVEMYFTVNLNVVSEQISMSSISVWWIASSVVDVGQSESIYDDKKEFSIIVQMVEGNLIKLSRGSSLDHENIQITIR